MRNHIHTLILAAALALGAQGPARAQLPTGFSDVLVADTLRFVVGMAFLPDGRLLVTEAKTARLRVLANGAIGTVGVPDSVDAGQEEEGLLGVAPDPGWPARPYLYLFHDALDQKVWIVRYNVAGDLSDGSSTNLSLVPGSRYTILRDIPDVMPNHNGGTLRFGPDGMLWSALAEDAIACKAQDLASLGGVVVRMDVSGLPDGGGGPADKALLAPPDNPFPGHASPNARLVWAYGLRNPFRFHIDPSDGVLYLGDVGWTAREEIDVCDAPGQNFGWPFFEGTHVPFPMENPICGYTMPPPGLVGPIHEYPNPVGLASVMAGPVYRSTGGACAFPAEYQGDLFFTDHYDGVLRRFKKTAGVWNFAPAVNGQPSATDWARGVSRVTDFAVGPDGALWYVRYGNNFLDSTGQVRRICYTNPLIGVPARAGGSFEFSAPWPSPARGSVSLAYTLSRPGWVSLTLYDAAGRIVRRLVPEREGPAGRHEVAWDGTTMTEARAAAGIYVARITVDGVSRERRVPLLR